MATYEPSLVPNDPPLVGSRLSDYEGSVDEKLPSEQSASHVYQIHNTLFRNHYNVSTAQGKQLYRVENSSCRPKKPDLTFHAGSDENGPTVAVCKFLHFSRHLKVGLGDPNDINGITYEDLLAQDHRHAKYRWQMTMQTARGPERHSFLCTRTHSVGIEEDHKTNSLSNRNFKLVDEQTGKVVGVFTNAVWKNRETGRLHMYVDYGQEFDLMALVTVLALYEKARRRRDSAAASGNSLTCFGAEDPIDDCDELRPSCSNCSKRLATCEYDSSASLLWTNEEPPSRIRSKKSSPAGVSQSESPAATTANSLSILGRWGDVFAASQAVPSLNITDLELMMQWCNSTHKSVSRGEHTDHIWRFRASEEAIAHPFLMHGLLALSSLHIARTKHDTQQRPIYLSTAVAHQAQALALFRERLSDINSSNARAMFAFASVVVYYTFGLPHAPESSDPWANVDDLLQIFTLARGVQQILKQATSVIKNDEWSIIFKVEDLNEDYLRDAQSSLERLHELNNACGAQDDTHDTAAYENALDRLAEMLAEARTGMPSVSTSCRWAIRQFPEFMELLRERKPLALVILAYHCVVFHHLRDAWYMGDRGSRVARALWDILDDEWRPLIESHMLEIFGKTHPTNTPDTAGIGQQEIDL
ncbi:Zn(II)2Cys6 transcription factor domain-containing protein [Aspergillus neoniger CBS 115656]|uniref:C6 zinc finger domain protein n=1 Tax=Aspergillus neoniger (strain CBS 115656) TaxID=1448310 RepID=A0A318Y8T4_ASPNB|nr:C6 zinc finger domain protein [Aspergillus neoniger CBS 115656]PYH30701.1 C6 zinc finger domain protein [Aspergillus neoniger CBS 115656]